MMLQDLWTINMVQRWFWFLIRFFYFLCLYFLAAALLGSAPPCSVHVHISKLGPTSCMLERQMAEFSGVNSRSFCGGHLQLPGASTCWAELPCFSQRQGSDAFKPSFSWLTFRNAILCGGGKNMKKSWESWESWGPQGSESQVVLCNGSQNNITFTSWPWKQHQCLELKTHALKFSSFFVFKRSRSSCSFRGNE